jgi:rubredoxin
MAYRRSVGDPTCSRCGRSKATAAPIDALAWVSERTNGHLTWLCPTCARTHVRDIEGKLPEEYW